MSAPSMLPDRAILASFLDVIFRHCDRSGRVAFKAFDGEDRPVFTTSTLKLSHPTLNDAAFNLARVAATCGRTAVFCPPISTFRDTWAEIGRQSTATDAIHEGPALSVDADSSPAAAWEALVAILGEPSITVLSGGEWVDPETGKVQEKVHMHWRLDVPARGAALADLHEARWLACKIAGGDGTGAPVAHPFRWPGSVHNKGKPRLCTIGQQTENEIRLLDALAALRAAWAGPGFHDRAAVEIATSGPRTATDDDVASALSVIPNGDMVWPEWKRVAMAVWAATSGGGFDVFDAWSRTSAKYTPKGTAEAWKKIDRSPPSSLGAGSLFWMANEADPSWTKPSEQVTEEDTDFAELRAPAVPALALAKAPAVAENDFAELRALDTVKVAAVAVEAANDEGSAEPDGAFPDHLTRVPGLLGWVVDWIEATARQPSRVMALGAALAVLGTLMGQRTGGPTASGTHLYTVAIAPSAMGKEHGLRCINILLKAANSAERIGDPDFMSASALIKTVIEKPCCVCPMDEFGAFLSKLSNPRASTHETGISKVLRTLWGLSFEEYATPKWANGHSDRIEYPALGLYGVTVAEEFFKSLRREAIQDGFLNRFLMLRHTEAVRDRDPALSRKVVPEDLAGALLAFNAHHRDVTAGTFKAGEGRDVAGAPAFLYWANDGAKDVYKAMQDAIFDLRQDAAVSPYYGRTGEIAVRLAAIHAAGRSLREVDAAAMAWGRDVARWSAANMLSMTGEHLAENLHADNANRVVRIMRDKGPVTRREIMRAMNCALKVKDLAEILATLIEAGRIVEVKPQNGEPAGRGRPTDKYRLVRGRKAA